MANCMSSAGSTFLQQYDCVLNEGFAWRLPKLVRTTQIRYCKKISEGSMMTKSKRISPVTSTYLRGSQKQADEGSTSETAESSSGSRASLRRQLFTTQSVRVVVTVMRKVKTFGITTNEDMMDTMDAVADQLGFASILLQLVSDEIDPSKCS